MSRDIIKWALVALIVIILSIACKDACKDLTKFAKANKQKNDIGLGYSEPNPKK